MIEIERIIILLMHQQIHIWRQPSLRTIPIQVRPDVRETILEILLELLDAQRTFRTIAFEARSNLADYWTSVFRLEQAVGRTLQ